MSRLSKVIVWQTDTTKTITHAALRVVIKIIITIELSSLTRFTSRSLCRAQCTTCLEVARNCVAVLPTPDNLYQLGVWDGNLATHAERIVDIQFLFPSVLHHVLRQCRNVAQTLNTDTTAVSVLSGCAVCNNVSKLQGFHLNDRRKFQHFSAL